MIDTNEHSSIIYRSIKHDEHDQALHLWYSVFEEAKPGCFERDFTNEGSPTREEDDTIGAWHNGKLVSAIHIRRVQLQSRDENNVKYLCGGMSNVATLPDYRNQGISRNLLRMGIKHMEKENKFDLSILGTGICKHYSVLGWEQMNVPTLMTIEWKNFDKRIDNIHWYATSEIIHREKQLLLDLYTKSPREYQFDRSPSTFLEHFVGWNWQLEKDIIYICRDNQLGYIVIGKAEDIDNIYISEWRAPNVEVEQKLFSVAVQEIQRRQKQQTNNIRVHGLPQHMTLNEFEQWAGKINIEYENDMMIRNVQLPHEIFEKIKVAYSKGSATFWQGDMF
ncbi:unnamed protein product [Adineta ricciae]|uniref:N-acetyltransferase domain-containing protein n=1 Tax=Adineta ricciae TaxID=249248 RepID=A0A816DFT4_ADIRI|nr:unnamed protein product [Adineta ricciae]CAF1635798.1 unnamed protein product [Adineta ricciae]